MNSLPKKTISNTPTARDIHKPAWQNRAAMPRPAAMPVYHPCPTPLVLQPKAARPTKREPATKDKAKQTAVTPPVLALGTLRRSGASVQRKPSVPQRSIVQLSKSKWKEKTATPKNVPVVTASVSGTTSYSGLQYGQKITLLRPYLDNTYPKTNYKVNYSGHTEWVYDIGNGRWGYIDTSHGEIEVLTAGVTSGTTLGYIPLRFAYTTETRQLGTGQPYDVTVVGAITEAAFIAGKTHTYNLFT